MSDEPLPLQPPSEPVRRTPAPAWVALATAWLGLASLAMAVALPFVPGSRHPTAELTHQQGYSPADRLLPFAVYGPTLGIVMGLIVLRQMGTEPKPMADALVAQRMQAWAGIVLSVIAILVIYVFTALRGPTAAG